MLLIFVINRLKASFVNTQTYTYIHNFEIRIFIVAKISNKCINKFRRRHESKNDETVIMILQRITPIINNTQHLLNVNLISMI